MADQVKVGAIVSASDGDKDFVAIVCQVNDEGAAKLGVFVHDQNNRWNWPAQVCFTDGFWPEGTGGDTWKRLAA